MATGQSPLLKIYLLGGLEFKLADLKPLHFPSRRAEIFLAFLALNPQAHTRDYLADLLWDARTQARSLSNLRSLMAQMPAAIKPFLRTDRQTVELRQEMVWTDVAEFEHPLNDNFEPTAVENALRLYRGDFLEGIYLRESEGLNEWINFTRERLWELAIQSNFQVAQFHFYHRNHSSALAHIRQVLKMDPLREDGHELAMRLFARKGQLKDAISQYRKCEEIFLRELNAPPSARLRQLYSRLNHAAHMPATPLPAQTRPLVGRVSEMASITESLSGEGNRLITLTGPGGVGKTRLALEIANAVKDYFINGVFFISFASIEEVNMVPSILGAGLGLDFQGKEPPVNELHRYLENLEILLVLDNLEGLLPQISSLVKNLIEAGPWIKIVVTSRERLNIPQEFVFPVSGLPYQANGERSEAVQFFISCARKHNQHFEVTASSEGFVSRICSSLQGLPLGIEFAAAWAHILPMNDIADEIERDLNLLVARDDRSSRHRSLSVAFDYSWNRLSRVERKALLRLSMFRSGFSREAAQAVGDADIRVLASLVDKSLIHKDDSTDRYSMLEVFRWYVIERWDDQDPGRAETQAAYVEYFAEWLRKRIGAAREAIEEDTLRGIDQELGNLRQAWSLAFTHQETESEQLETYLSAIYLYYHSRSYFGDGFSIFESLLGGLSARSRPDDDELVRAECLARLGSFAISLGKLDLARSYLMESQSLMNGRDNSEELAFLLRLVSTLNYFEARYPEAESAATESMRVSAAIGDFTGEAISLRQRGIIQNALGNYHEATGHLEKSLSIHKRAGNRLLYATLSNDLGNTLCEIGEYERALELYHECLTLHRESNNRYKIGLELNNIATVYTVLGEFEKAVRLLEECFEICEEIGDKQGLGVALLNLGYCDLMSGNFKSARLYLERSQEVFQTVDYVYMELLGMIFLGEVAIKEGDFKRALFHLKEVIRRSRDSNIQPFVLKALVWVAVIWEHGDNSVRALALIRFIKKQAASNLETLQSARDVEDRLLNKLNPGDVERADNLMGKFELNRVVEEVLATKDG